MTILEQTIDLVAPVVALLITWGFAELARFIHGKVPDGPAHRALLRLNEAVGVRVQQANQVLVDAARKRSADGKLSKEEAAEVLGDVRHFVLQDLGETGVRDLKYIVQPEQIERFIEAKIEAAVRAGKKGESDAS